MPSRYYQRLFAKGHFYHIYNRGANKQNVFFDQADYKTFIDILGYYLTFPHGKPLSILPRLKEKDSNIKVRNLDIKQERSSISLAAFCLMPNHFHLLIKQTDTPTETNNISNLMRRLIITYAMYTKKKYERSGVLFEGKFKNVVVLSDKQLLQLSKYIHRNPLSTQGSEPLENYPYSSYCHFSQPTKVPAWLKPGEIMSFFSKANKNQDYKKFVEDSPSGIESISDLAIDTQGSEP